MASLIYTSCLHDLARGTIDFSAGQYKVMLVRAAYSPDKTRHTRRSDIVGEVTGDGYSSGGQMVRVGIIKAATRVDVTLGSATWEAATITATGAVYYLSSGDDPLVAFVDFGDAVISTNGTFALTDSVLRFQN